MNAQLDAVLRHLHTLAIKDLADLALLDRYVKDRDETAFAELTRRHGPLVLAVCRRILGHEQDAEDAFQATFLVLARKAGLIRKGEAVASWLYHVAYRVAMRERSNAAKRHVRERQCAHADTPEPAYDLAWQDLQRVLDEELNRLPAKYRATFVLCCLEGKSRPEAAKDLGCKEGTVSSRLARARQQLQERLSRRGVTLAAALIAAGISESTATATVPVSLAAASVKAAMAFACSPAAAAGLASAKAELLAKSMLQSMALAPVKMAMALVTVACLAATGAGLAHHASSAKQAEPPSVNKGDNEQQKAPGKPTAEEKQVLTDRFGDPLPAGAIARLGTVRFRHGNGATLAFSPDGRSVLTFGSDRTIRTWDLGSGRPLCEQHLPPEFVAPAGVLSSDGSLLAFLDVGLESYNLWDVRTKRLRHKLPLGERNWHQAIFSPNGKTLVTVQYGGVLKAWDVITGESRLLGKVKGVVRSLSFAANGTLMSLNADRSLSLWDLAGNREQSRLTLSEHIAGAVISPDGRIVAIRSFHNEEIDKGVQFWDAATGAPAKGWIAPPVKKVNAVRFAPDGKSVLIGSGAGVVVWDAIAGKQIRTLPGGTGHGITLSPDGKTVAAFGKSERSDGDSRGTVVHVWDLATGTAHRANAIERGHLGEVDGVAIAPDGRTVASSCRDDRSVRLWEAATGRLLLSLNVNDLTIIGAVAFTPDGKHMLAGTSPAIICWEVATGREVGRYRLFEPGKDEPHHLMVMHLSTDGRTLRAVSQNLNGKEGAFGLHTWDVASCKRLSFVALSADHLLVGYSRFSPDGSLLVLPGGSIRDAATGKELLHLSISDRLLWTPVAFSANGAFLATGLFQRIDQPGVHGMGKNSVQIWELATGLPVVRLETGDLAHLAFTPDGRRVLTASRDALKVWDLDTGRAMATRPAPGRFHGSFGASFASSFALAANGRMLATGQPDTTVLVWNFPPTFSGRPTPLSTAELEACWSDLASDDAGCAHASVCRLVDTPKQALALLRDHLQAAQAPPADALQRLVADLDAPQFARREAATKRLTHLSELAEAALRESLRDNPSLEARRRIETILAVPRLARVPEVRRHLRALRVLEMSGTSEARRVLEMLAKGAPEARVTREAKASLERLATRPADVP